MKPSEMPVDSAIPVFDIKIMNRLLRNILLVMCPLASAGVKAEMSERVFPTTAEYIDTLEEKSNALYSLALTKSEVAENDSMLYKYYYYEASRYKALAKFDSASIYFNKCIELDSTKSQPYAELAQYHSYIAKKNPPKSEKEVSLWDVSAAALMQKAVSLDSSNINNLEMHVEFALKVRDYKYAVQSLKRLLKLRPDKMESYVLLASTYQELQRPYDALEVWNQLESVYGYTTGITNQKFIIWVNYIKDNKKALAEYDKPIKKYPYNSSFAMNKVLAYQKLGMYRSAEKYLFKCKKKYPNDISKINLELLTMYMRVQAPKKIEEVIDVVLEDKNTEFDIKGMLVDELQRDTICSGVVTEKRLKRFVETYPNEHLSYLLYANYLLSSGRMDETCQLLESSLKVDSQQEEVWSMLMEFYSQKKNLSALNSTLERAVAAMPESFEFRYRQGRWKLMNNDRPGAIECFKVAVDLSKNLDMFKSAMIACEIADVYSFMNDTTKATEWYEKSLEIDPNCILTFNNYAYMLCVQGRDLDRAETMSAKTITAEPMNPVYLDTYAWIYYTKGSYLSAQLYIEQAIKNCPNPLGEIYEHYGFILYKLGEVDKAREAWKKAYDLYEIPSDELKRIVENGELPEK